MDREMVYIYSKGENNRDQVQSFKVSRFKGYRVSRFLAISYKIYKNQGFKVARFQVEAQGFIHRNQGFRASWIQGFEV
jgi:hypothetical protein